MVSSDKLESSCYLDVQGFLPEVTLLVLNIICTLVDLKIILLKRIIDYIFFFIIRFCSRPFTLASGHESIHLCNNAVQTKYANAERSSKLPPDNMWDNKVNNVIIEHFIIPGTVKCTMFID